MLEMALSLPVQATRNKPKLLDHASWMENFPWTRLANIEMPREQKPLSDVEKLRRLDPKSLREYLKDGNYGGLYQRDHEEMMKIWRTGVEETRNLLNEEWD